MAYYPGKEIIREALETLDVGEISDCLDVHPSHVYNVEHRGVSPTLYKALVKGGWINKPKVYTLAFRFRCREDFEKARAAVDATGDRTRALLEMIDSKGDG